MERTRHFVATAYIVHDGATALHKHERLDTWLPPGGHIEHGELPREAATREVAEETGLEVTLHGERGTMSSPTVTALAGPAHLLLEDITTTPDGVAHQHIDFVYFGSVSSKQIEPAPGETPSEAWEWFTSADLETHSELDDDVRTIGAQAIETIEATSLE